MSTDIESLKSLTRRVAEERSLEDCPFCLERLPDFWLREKYCCHYQCCGKFACKQCHREWYKTAGALATHCPNCRSQIPKTDIATFNQLMRSAKEGKAWAQCEVAWFYEVGRGVTKDPTEAITWYKKAALQGWHEASSNLGAIYSRGQVVKRNEIEARRWLEIAAVSGDALPLFNLSNALTSDSDREEKLRALQQAAEKGLPDAQHNWARTVSDGKDCLYWCVRAADQGYEMSQHLASIVTHDLYGKAGIPRAYYWIQKAAASNDADRRVKILERKKNLEETICRSCAGCGKETSSTVSLHRCLGCKAICYCSRECQTADWKAGHKKHCIPKDIEDRTPEERLKFFTTEL